MKTQFPTLRTRYFVIRPEYLITLGLMILLVLAFTASLAHAGTRKHHHTSTTTTTTTDGESEDEPVTSATPAFGEPTQIQESEINTVFGSRATTGIDGCKTEELSKNVVKDLKADCKAWVKDQRADLKGRFRTSTCEESCTDCGMSLKRCNVNGTVRYQK